MKKFLPFLLLAAALMPANVKAQNPEAIYIATWVKMSDLGTPITPSASDPVLIYNSDTGCYEGQVIDWPRVEVNPYNAKIPYSVADDGTITYYGVVGTTQLFIFNTYPSASFGFRPSTSPAGMKGYALSSANLTSIVDVKVSVNLSTNTITFTQFESGEGTKLPELLDVVPANGSYVTPADDGSVTITLTFSSKVDSMEVSSEDYSISVAPNDAGTVWTITVPQNVIQSSASENQGNLVLKIHKVYANGLPVGFGAAPALGLSYPVEGITSVATINFTGSLPGLESLKVYKKPYYTVDDALDIVNNTLEFSYRSSVSYLFTVSLGYSVVVTSTVDSDSNLNWALGSATVAGSTDVTRGTELTVYAGSNGATFTVTVTSSEDSGVESIFGDNDGELKIYNLQGARVANPVKGQIYIVNGKKVVY